MSNVVNFVKSQNAAQDVKYVMSTDVLNFSSVIDEFMQDQRIDLLVAYRGDNGQIKLRGAHDSCGTLICDVLMESD